MGWTTLYIAGKGDFREEVREKLEDSRLDLMPGYTGMYSLTEETHDLYWVDESTPVRAIKEAIGSKLVWKYRLNFYPSLEALVQAQENKKGNGFSEDDLMLIEGMRAMIR